MKTRYHAAAIYLSSLLAVLSPLACVSHADEPPPVPAGEAWLTPQQVTEGKVSMNPIGRTEVGAAVITSGRVTFDDLQVSHVSSPVTGRVSQISVDLGARVHQGQTLAVIESPDVGIVSSDLDKARSSLQTAEKDLHRQQSLYAAQASTQRDMEAAEGTFARAQAEYDRAVKKAKLFRGEDGNVSQHYSLRAPIDGEVVARMVNPGVEIQGQYSGNGAELFTIGNLERVWVLADIYESDLGRIQRGQQVRITVPAYANQTFTGTVDWVSSVLDPNTRTAKVRCVVQNAERKLKPEMQATVTVAATGTEQLTVAKDSVVRLGEKTVVFVQVSNAADGHLRFERRPVIVDDAVDSDRYPVLHGLKDGEIVVVHGADRLAEMI